MSDFSLPNKEAVVDYLSTITGGKPAEEDIDKFNRFFLWNAYQTRIKRKCSYAQFEALYQALVDTGADVMEFIHPKSISIETDKGTIFAEFGGDEVAYPEIYLCFAAKGREDEAYQVAVLDFGPQPGGTADVIPDDSCRLLVWADNTNDSYTDTFVCCPPNEEE